MIHPKIPYTLNCRGRLCSLERPLVMGILNITPDSFSDGGLYMQKEQALRRVEEMCKEGVDMVDIGAYSSRPFADPVSAEEELRRLAPIVPEILRAFPEILVSIDTYRSNVAGPVLEMGVHMINDISGGTMDPELWPLLAKFKDVPYILMHMKGSPQTMQIDPQYDHVVSEVQTWLTGRVHAARAAGIRDVIIDPGFGFGKQMTHNYQLMAQLEVFAAMGLPLLVGISRKSMLYKMFDTAPGDVLELTSALHLKALEKGANILRVHDVKAAKRIIRLFGYLEANGTV